MASMDAGAATVGSIVGVVKLWVKEGEVRTLGETMFEIASDRVSGLLSRCSSSGLYGSCDSWRCCVDIVFLYSEKKTTSLPESGSSAP